MTSTQGRAGDMAQEHNFKVVLLGEGCVGKTSMVLRYVMDQFNEAHNSTVQASYLKKTVAVGMKRANLAIWDTAGQEMFHALGPIYYRDSNGALLVYDITDEDSFRKVQNWVLELNKMLGDQVVLVLVGNKSDLEASRAVPLSKAERYARSVGAAHFQTSAKLNRGINEVFLYLCKELLDRNAKGEERRPQTSQRRRLQVEASEEPQPTSSKCC